MGRIKTTPLKRVTLELLDKHKDKFSDSFEKNKEAVSELTESKSKKLRNIVAGYVTRLVRKEQKRKL
jgi:small subunit ribosomal protein S17e